ncbi:MAG: SIR2 family protein [Pseudomonadota bacterium]
MDEDRTVAKHLDKVRRKFAGTFAPRTSKDEHSDEDSDDEPIPEPVRNPVEAILKHTHSRRILTTNYDTEFERFLFDRWLTSEPTSSEAYDQFEAVGAFDPKKAREYPRKISVDSPLRRSIMTASIDTGNVGDLVNFASFSRTEEYQVFHLHGRLDRPAEMVVTRRDYRRIYAQDPSSAEAFQASQEILFTGNDVLMVGFGGEEDILLPFRRFVARGRAADQSPRRTFALMPSDTSKHYKRRNANDAIHWALDYDIYTIHYGGKRFRETAGALKTIRDCITKARVKGIPDTPVFSVEALTAIRNHRIRSTSDDSRQKCALISEARLAELEQIAAAQPDQVAEDHAVKTWCEEAARTCNLAMTETYSNAMIYELSELDRLSRDWWDAWRHTPYERRARYHVAGGDIAGRPGYLSVRHCSIWDSRLLQEPATDWPPLVEARKVAAQRLTDQPLGGRRVLRFTAQRGTGQATFANLLHNEQNQKHLFGLEEGEAYTGAFIAHLSFSMEFNSVLKAFSRFLCYWIAKRVAALPAARPSDDTMALRRAARKEHHDRQVAEARQLFTPGLGLGTRSLAAFERLRGLAKDLRVSHDLKAYLLAQLRDPQRFAQLQLSGQALETVARELVAVAWEDDQNLLHMQSLLALSPPELLPAEAPDQPASLTVQRRHRLDMLRDAMADYSSVAGGHRLFACLSGLDRIADGDGDAYNPAHRAFFRLLVAREERSEPNDYLRTALKALPLDIVLIAGRPDAPIAYLSEEFDPKKNVADDPDGARQPKSGDFQRFSRRSATKRLLERWDELPAMGWEQRIAMLGITVSADDRAKSEAAEDAYQKNPRSEDRDEGDLPGEGPAAAIFLRWAEATRSDFSHRDINDLHESSHIHRLLWENLSLSLWVMRLWIFQKDVQAKKGLSPVRRGFHSFLRDLDGAAARDGFSGVVQYILGRYETLDRKRRDGRCRKYLGKENTYEPELHATIMRHLVLFALPVEPWVLLGCPKILDILREEYKERCKEADALPIPTPEEQNDAAFRQAYLSRIEWHERAFMLRELQKALEELVGRALIMKVQPAADALQTTDSGEDPPEKPETFLHQRYSIHNRMRQHIAHIIRLGVHDGADINHHRMSIYCDQPRELPSPSHEHFDLVRNIVEYQIDRCRDTLAAMFQLGHERRRVKDFMEGWDTDDGLASVDPDQEPPDTDRDGVDDRMTRYAAARRIFAPDPKATPRLAELHAALDARAKALDLRDWAAADGLGGSLGRLHAVPQRLRAMLSVLQGSFAIGSLSRMTQLRESLSDEAQTPFDAYRGWLRSLLNAGASLDRTQGEFERVFSGSTFQDRANVTNGVSSWLSARMQESASAMAMARIIEGEDRIRSAGEEIGLRNTQMTAHRTMRHPFYRDEIAWLYNERGLAALTQGLVFDALPLLRQAAFIMSHRRVPISDSHAFHAAERRIYLNYGIALLERGNIAEAQRVLKELHIGSMQIRRSTPSEIEPFSKLYLAVCDHVGGSFHRAEKSYRRLQNEFSDRNQFRAVAITCKSHADLCRARGALDDGLELAELAIKAASRSEQRDVEHLSMVSKARLLILGDERKDAMQLIDRSLTYARQMGLMSIEIDAKIAMSALMNSQGDYSLAGQFASEAAARSVRCGLRLRKLSALLGYADSRRARGSLGFSNRLFGKIAREAEEVGYMTVAGLATSELSK